MMKSPNSVARVPGIEAAAWGAAMIWLATHAAAAPMSQTYTFKKAGDLEIKADVYRPEAKDAAGKRPVVVWIHGGGMINGSRAGVFGPMLQPLLDSGCVVVSIDYRLAPETKLPELVADIEDAFRWIRKAGPELFNADPDRIGVFGGSAGGFLTLVAGFRVEPRPKALVSLWGYGDVLEPWSAGPSPYPRHRTTDLSPEEAKQQELAPPVADSRERRGNGGAFYQYVRRTGTWPQALTGWDPQQTPEKFFPYMPVRNVTPAYPPTLLIHGEADTDVAYSSSVAMAEQFKKHGVEHRLISFPGGEHGLQGIDKADTEPAYREAVEFLVRHLQTPLKPGQ